MRLLCEQKTFKWLKDSSSHGAVNLTISCLHCLSKKCFKSIISLTLLFSIVLLLISERLKKISGIYYSGKPWWFKQVRKFETFISKKKCTEFLWVVHLIMCVLIPHSKGKTRVKAQYCYSHTVLGSPLVHALWRESITIPIVYFSCLLAWE